MERPKPATIAWGALIAGVALYDCFCPTGETLSEGADRALERPVGKYLALGAIGATALHLANAVPQQFDIIHYALAWKNTNGNA